MPYVIQSLPQKSVVSATIHETVSIDELKFVLRDIYKRVNNRRASALTHIVLDTTSQVFPSTRSYSLRCERNLQAHSHHGERNSKAQ